MALGPYFLLLVLPVQYASAGIAMSIDAGGIPGKPGEIGFEISAHQLQLNARCAAKCLTEVCYLADENDCRNFLTCQRDAKGRYHGIVQMCAFGTMWAGLQKQKKITCDRPSNVICLIDYCAGRLMNENFPHQDGNCKTYWTCEGKGPVPRCCAAGYMYDDRSNTCVQDHQGICMDACPFKTDACLINQQATAYFDDRNCRTFWDCADNNPHPVCCTNPGEGYDPSLGACVSNGCMDECPQEYHKDVCLQPGVETYPIHDGSCRTYMRCNAVDGDERWCCPSGNIYDPMRQACVPTNGDITIGCSDSCPIGWREFCPLTPDPTNPANYMTLIHDSPASMPCAPGTLFDIASCSCGTQVKNAPDNSCNMEVEIIFDQPTIVRSGSQNSVEILRSGLIEETTRLNGRMPWRFNGNLVNRIPYAQQPFHKVFVSIIFLPEQPVNGAGVKQILLSNCMNLDLGGPSFEVALKDGRVAASVATDTVIKTPSGAPQAVAASVSVPYQVGQWQVLTVMYDGSELSLALEGSGNPAFDTQPLIGSVPVAAEGLDFGGCHYTNKNQPIDGFVGSMAKLQFSKCLKQDWVDSFNAIVHPINGPIVNSAGPI